MDEIIAVPEEIAVAPEVETVTPPPVEEVVAEHVVEYVPAGEEVVGFSPGDFILTHREDWTAKLIMFGQGRRFTGADAPFAYFSHCAMITSPDGDIVEALTESGVTKRNISEYKNKEYVVVHTQQTDSDREEMVVFTNAVIGRKYGWVTCISLALSLLTGLKFNFGIDGEMICSGLVAEALERGTDRFERDGTHMMPADLAKHYNIRNEGNS